MKQDDHLDPNSGGPETSGFEADGTCERVLELLPTFVDGEASESLASAVRKHLIDCADCRVVAQEETSLRQWFEPIAGEAGRVDVLVPEGFAARVTAMAFGGLGSGSDLNPSGDRGSDRSTPMHAAGTRAESQERRGPRLLRSVDAFGVDGGPADRVARSERSSLGFPIGLTAVAAALMATFTLMLAQDKRLEISDAPLSADAAPLDEALRELDALNEVEILLQEDGPLKDGPLEKDAPVDGNPDLAAPTVDHEADNQADTSQEGGEPTDSPKGPR